MCSGADIHTLYFDLILALAVESVFDLCQL